MKLLALAPSIALSLAASTVAAPAAAQGADLCVFAQPIAGAGTFPVDTSFAATDGLANACGENGQIHNDVWFRWTSSVSGPIQMDTCAAADFDTTLAVYPDESCATAAPLVAQLVAMTHHFLAFPSSRAARCVGSLSFSRISASLLSPVFLSVGVEKKACGCG